MIYNRENIVSENGKLTKDDFVFFWRPCKPGKTDKGCFCQWCMSDFIINGQRYCCAEQYMMAKKAELFHDKEILKEILNERSPKRIRELGRLVKNFDVTIWNEHKVDYIRRANFVKFTQNRDLRDFICTTEGKILVEASPFDRIWGIGMGENNVKCFDPALWRGLNLLGFTLMEVRDEILIRSKESRYIKFLQTFTDEDTGELYEGEAYEFNDKYLEDAETLWEQELAHEQEKIYGQSQLADELKNLLNE